MLQVMLSYAILIGGFVTVVACYWLSDDLPPSVGRYRWHIAILFVVITEVIFGGMRMLFHTCRGMVGRWQFYNLLQIIGVLFVTSSTQQWIPSLLILVAVVVGLLFRRKLFKLLCRFLCKK